MTNHSTLPTVAVFNSNDDFLDLMRRYLNAAGYVAVTLSMLKVKAGEVEISSYISEHDPKIIVYDVAFPYKENWQQCQNLRDLDICQDRDFIITTPNLDALHDQIGKPVGAFQLVDKEMDLSKVIDLVNKVWQKRQEAQDSVRPQPRHSNIN